MITIKDKKGLITLKGQHCVWFNPEKGMWKIHIKMISAYSCEGLRMPGLKLRHS